MVRRLANLTLDTLSDLPGTCRGCVFWELSPVAAGQVALAGDPALEKEAWVSQTLLEWGCCGKVGYVDETPAGYVLYAPPNYLPGGHQFPTGPPSADAIVIAAVQVSPAYGGVGLGRALVQAAVRDLGDRGFRAVEAFGDRSPGEAGPALVSGCVAPADFYVSVGFKTIHPHPRYPRLRLDLHRGPSWWVVAGASELERAGEPVAGTVQDELSVAAAGVPLAVPAASSWRSCRTSMVPVATSDSEG
ncbi:GNAT family N-acetyltransferase [Natronosporangium hydrolyticum]|uniref:GNAT family N-acetyltransferase n=1 Tax=Natronosporangium hydrolyticum TaxID=2811111 RepID=A0A895YAP1_9ACTN|nr:GNAT family N-acetyltransferase [Natronosporangium hydrolyticum]QSB14817.1 GNAT family N-acetyltransferase [Natronosporangium hydrolyticum]